MRDPMRTFLYYLMLVLLATGLTACGDGSVDASGASPNEPPAPITNRIDIPAVVRKNLGITFATVVPRHVRRTRRVPGRFEHLPEAHRAYLMSRASLKR